MKKKKTNVERYSNRTVLPSCSKFPGTIAVQRSVAYINIYLTALSGSIIVEATVYLWAY